MASFFKGLGDFWVGDGLHKDRWDFFVANNFSDSSHFDDVRFWVVADSQNSIGFHAVLVGKVFEGVVSTDDRSVVGWQRREFFFGPSVSFHDLRDVGLGVFVVSFRVIGIGFGEFFGESFNALGPTGQVIPDVGIEGRFWIDFAVFFPIESGGFGEGGGH